MLDLDTRAAMVLTEAWRRLPPVKRETAIAGIVLDDLGAKHGSWDPDTHILTLSTRLFRGESHMLPMLDVNGNDPPQVFPYVSRALHTSIHEASHAIGTVTGLDESDDWLALSGWVRADDDPEGTARYVEDRPGWEQGPSPWRHRLQTWFVRNYSRRSPFEDFADAVTHIALGWDDFFQAPHPYRENGIAKRKFLLRHVWGETGIEAIRAARQRWQDKILIKGCMLS